MSLPKIYINVSKTYKIQVPELVRYPKPFTPKHTQSFWHSVNSASYKRKLHKYIENFMLSYLRHLNTFLRVGACSSAGWRPASRTFCRISALAAARICVLFVCTDGCAQQLVIFNNILPFVVVMPYHAMRCQNWDFSRVFTSATSAQWPLWIVSLGFFMRRSWFFFKGAVAVQKRLHIKIWMLHISIFPLSISTIQKKT